METAPCGPKGPGAGQEIRRPARGGRSSFPDADFRRFRPALLGFGPCFFTRATRRPVCTTDNFENNPQNYKLKVIQLQSK